ncbi:CopG family transcriptional regulator [Oceanimonas smirnovii]|uniref:ribbon-helix-helix domain-containing protein n=1 Tax=Oceanimonas smirnovii TaxID=264574 RepID=UPI0003A9B61C|nr:CopG family transcriptional regulator [Oceanimonas smirnovii]
MSNKSQDTMTPDLDLQWETGALGQDEEFAKVSSQSTDQSINEALGLELVSIRLEKELTEDLKKIAEQNGISYQPLIRQAITRFIEAEKKRPEQA